MAEQVCSSPAFCAPLYSVPYYKRRLPICTRLGDDLKEKDSFVSSELSLNKSFFLFMKIYGFFYLVSKDQTNLSV